MQKYVEKERIESRVDQLFDLLTTGYGGLCPSVFVYSYANVYSIWVSFSGLTSSSQGYNGFQTLGYDI